MKNKSLVITLVVAVVVGAGGFFGGMKYQQSRRGTFNRQVMGTFNANGTRQTGDGANRGVGFRPVTGEIISTDDKSITVKLSDGSSKIVLLSDTTQINKAATAIKDDLKLGEKVMAIGQQNSDGSITAQNIQLNPNIPNPTQ